MSRDWLRWYCLASTSSVGDPVGALVLFESCEPIGSWTLESANAVALLGSIASKCRRTGPRTEPGSAVKNANQPSAVPVFDCWPLFRLPSAAYFTQIILQTCLAVPTRLPSRTLLLQPAQPIQKTFGVMVTFQLKYRFTDCQHAVAKNFLVNPGFLANHPGTNPSISTARNACGCHWKDLKRKKTPDTISWLQYGWVTNGIKETRAGSRRKTRIRSPYVLIEGSTRLHSEATLANPVLPKGDTGFFRNLIKQ